MLSLFTGDKEDRKVVYLDAAVMNGELTQLALPVLCTHIGFFKVLGKLISSSGFPRAKESQHFWLNPTAYGYKRPALIGVAPCRPNAISPGPDWGCSLRGRAALSINLVVWFTR